MNLWKTGKPQKLASMNFLYDSQYMQVSIAKLIFIPIYMKPSIFNQEVNTCSYWLPVSFHDMFKRPEEIFLETEVGKFSFFYEFHGELPQGIHCKEGYVFIRITPNLWKKKTTSKDKNFLIMYKTLHII